MCYGEDAKSFVTIIPCQHCHIKEQHRKQQTILNNWLSARKKKLASSTEQ
jgi:hypothetical protein